MTGLGRWRAIACALALSGCTVALPAGLQDQYAASAPASVVETLPAQEAGAFTETQPFQINQTPSTGAAPLRAPVEDTTRTIQVTAIGLSGLWMVNGPSSIDFEIGLLSGVRILYSEAPNDRDVCMIIQNPGSLRATCIAGFAPTAGGSFDEEDNQLRLRWWTGPLTVNFNGFWAPNATQIPGTLSGGLAGVSITGVIPMTLHKVWPQTEHVEGRGTAKLMRVVFEDLRTGGFTEAFYESIAKRRLAPAYAWPGAKEPSHILSYLGRIHILWHRGQTESVQDVYLVQSGQDVSLCRIGFSEHKLVVDFACQTVTE